MDRQRFISVPKDNKEIEDYDLGQDKPEQMVEWKVTEDEFDKLIKLDVFSRLNNECNN